MTERAIFFDRDGVINKELGDYCTKPEDFLILEDSLATLMLAQTHGFKIILITNQGGIDRALYTHDGLKQMHQKLIDACTEQGIHIDDVYYCPHHPIVGHCLCRKPEGLMLQKAIAKHHLNASKCLMIGDHDRDIEAASMAGVKGIRIQPNAPKYHLLKEEILKIIE